MHAWGPADASRLNSNPAPTMLINSCRIKDLGQYNARQCCRAYSQWYPWICMWALARDLHKLFKHFTTVGSSMVATVTCNHNLLSTAKTINKYARWRIHCMHCALFMTNNFNVRQHNPITGTVFTCLMKGANTYQGFQSRGQHGDEHLDTCHSTRIHKRSTWRLGLELLRSWSQLRIPWSWG